MALALAILFAIAGVPRARAAQWPNVSTSDSLYPGFRLDDVKWPEVSPETIAQINAGAAQAMAAAANTVPAVPATPATPAAPASGTIDTGLLDDNLVTGAIATKAQPAPPTFEARFPAEFSFEGGGRYWYSIGQNRFAFANNIFPFGNPTSTLDWDRMQGHSGEGFFRVDHHPTHFYLKGVIGGGVLKGGDMDDLDFLASQTNFSNTTSAVNGTDIHYATVDLGYALDVPQEGFRVGGFVGYHYWRERMTAFGLLCNGDQTKNVFCGPAGSTAVSFGTPVDIFDTTWQALRIGADTRITLYDRWTISGEIAFVPYAWATNNDSHLLRTDLGPVPNIVTHAQRGMGAEVEAFLDYKVLPHFEIGVGFRYWGLFTQSGTVDFGPTFSPDFPLTKLSTQRYGVLFEAKATF